MTPKKKLTGLLFLAGALVSLMLLAASLSNLQFLPGIPFPVGQSAEIDIQSVPAQKLFQTYTIPLTHGIFALIFIILLVYVPVRLITLINFRKILRLVPPLVLLIVIGYLLPKIPPTQPPNFPDEAPKVITSPPTNYPITPLGQPPQVLIWFVTIVIVVGMGLLVFRMAQKRLVSIKTGDQLSQEAENAINALKMGEGLRNVIIRCYLQMAGFLEEEQGIDRNAAMTVREFKERLEALGYPVKPVHQLTSLFEKIRYSKQQAGPEDERIAIESLSEIIKYSRCAVE